MSREQEQALEAACKAGEEVAALLALYPKAQQVEIIKALKTILFDDQKWDELPNTINEGLQWAQDKALFLENEPQRLQFVCAIIAGLHLTSRGPLRRRWDAIKNKAVDWFWGLARLCNRAVTWLADLLWGD